MCSIKAETQTWFRAESAECSLSLKREKAEMPVLRSEARSVVEPNQNSGLVSILKHFATWALFEPVNRSGLADRDHLADH